mgnify:CR=1 FL=1|tara:strand:+ start:343 stop:756 length:414 start_codon:yes stop_codon:yes gene_type:complete
MPDTKQQTVYTAKELRELKSMIENEKKIKAIKSFVKLCFNAVIKQAQTDDKQIFTSSTQQISSFYNGQFLKENEKLIINELETYLPDSKITIRTFSKFVDNKMYDISSIPENCKDIINSKYNENYIVIDWSEDADAN